MQISKQAFFSASLGTLIEYYDYALFLIFLPLTAPAFFHAASAYQALSKSYYILFATMLARPIGGLAFGYIGDMLGRRYALLASMYGIAIATLIIGLTPSYATLGVTATVIIIIAKTVQVFCFGGEYNGSGIYLVEHAKPLQESLIASLLASSAIAGSLLASSLGIILTASFMPDWSWRLAFIFGGLIGIVGIYYRKNLIESPQFKPADSNLHSLKQMFKLYPRELIAGFFCGGFILIPFTTIVGFIDPILMTKGLFTNQHLMLIQTWLNIVGIITLYYAGKWGDKKSAAFVLRCACWLQFLLAWPLLYLIDSFNIPSILFSCTIFIIINEIFLAPTHAYLKNLYAMQFRYRASSFSFCLGMSLLGGATPIIENKLYQATGHFSAIAIWFIIIAVSTYFSISAVQSKQRKLTAVRP